MRSSEQISKPHRSCAAGAVQRVQSPLYATIDNRPSALLQRKLQDAANQGMQVKQLKAVQVVSNAPVIQMVRYMLKNGTIVKVEGSGKIESRKKRTEAQYEEQILNSTRPQDQEEKQTIIAKRAAAQQENERLAHEENERKKAARPKERKEDREKRFNRVTNTHLPNGSDRRQTVLSDVVTADGQEADLLYRGMSVNNIHNMQTDPNAPVFTVMNPDGQASTLDHVVDDDKDSPYLSFEAKNPIVSGIKYAPKPAHAVSKEAQEVDIENTPSGKFRKQKKSYEDAAKERHKRNGFIRIGHVGGIRKDAGVGPHIDVSDQQKADAHFKPPVNSTMDSDRRKKASVLATADREVLVKPGKDGIGGDQLPFVASVKEVDQDYYEKHLVRQTPTKALGLIKPSKVGAKPTFVKMQIKKGNTAYKFDHHKDLVRVEDDSEDEMSDIEDLVVK